ncbi:MAG: alpha/beta hydrolase [bacterium]
MMKQIVVIGGGDAFPTYDAYLSFLKNFKAENIDYFKETPNWKSSLQEVLGDEYEVLAPRMPNKSNAKYVEWEIWFEKMFPFLNGEVILVGHSLGASFLAKYLSEEQFPKKILATFLVAGPYDSDGERQMVEFILPDSLSLLEEQGGKMFLYHSKDDPVVAFSELAKYQKALPNAKSNVFEDRKHFNQESFPEIIADIQNIL